MKEKKIKEALPVETPAFMEQLDEVFLHKIRLAACVLLTRQEALSFTLLKKALLATDGNLGAQLRKLEEVGYVTMKKEFHDRKPVTWYSMTKKGKEALGLHLDGISAVLQQVNRRIPSEILTIKDKIVLAEPDDNEKTKQVKTTLKKEESGAKESIEKIITTTEEQVIKSAESEKESFDIDSVSVEPAEETIEVKEEIIPLEPIVVEAESAAIETSLSASETKPESIEPKPLEPMEKEIIAEQAVSTEIKEETVPQPVKEEEKTKEKKKEKSKEDSKAKKEIKDPIPSLFDF